jgi:hypothetical protein
MKHFDKVGGEMLTKQRIYIVIDKSKDIIAKCKLDYDLYKLGEIAKQRKTSCCSPNHNIN